MKKKSVVVLLMLVLLSSVNGFTGDRFRLSVRANYLAPADTGFKDIYGSSVFFPGMKAEFAFTKSLYAWADVGFFSISGTTPILQWDATSNQTLFSVGVGYTGIASGKLSYTFELGLLHVSYKEESLDEVLEDSSIGFNIGGGLVYDLGKSFFGEFFLGYLTASDTVEDVSIKPGGFRTGIGLGVKF